MGRLPLSSAGHLLDTNSGDGASIGKARIQDRLFFGNVVSQAARALRVSKLEAIVHLFVYIYLSDISLASLHSQGDTQLVAI
jgi:hypothetical protein